MRAPSWAPRTAPEADRIGPARSRPRRPPGRSGGRAAGASTSGWRRSRRPGRRPPAGVARPRARARCSRSPGGRSRGPAAPPTRSARPRRRGSRRSAPRSAAPRASRSRPPRERSPAGAESRVFLGCVRLQDRSRAAPAQLGGGARGGGGRGRAGRGVPAAGGGAGRARVVAAARRSPRRRGGRPCAVANPDRVAPGGPRPGHPCGPATQARSRPGSRPRDGVSPGSTRGGGADRAVPGAARERHGGPRCAPLGRVSGPPDRASERAHATPPGARGGARAARKPRLPIRAGGRVRAPQPLLEHTRDRGSPGGRSSPRCAREPGPPAPLCGGPGGARCRAGTGGERPRGHARPVAGGGAREHRPDRRAPRRAAAGHRARHLPRGGPLSGAAEALALCSSGPRAEALAEALADVNGRLLAAATPLQREIFQTSTLDATLLEGSLGDERAAGRRRCCPARSISLRPFLPRKGIGLALSASDIYTYRSCPLRYKFARVLRIPSEQTVHQRFGIVVHQVLERYHSEGGSTLAQMLDLLDAVWRRSGLATASPSSSCSRRPATPSPLPRAPQRADAEPVWFERAFDFRLGPHHLRGRVDRVDRLPAGRGSGVRADRLQDLAAEDRRAARGRRPAVPVRARRARRLGAGVLQPGLLLRARRPQGAGPPQRRGRGGGQGDRCSRWGRGSSDRTSSRPPPRRSARSATTGSCARRPRGSRPGMGLCSSAPLAQEALEFPREHVAGGDVLEEPLCLRCRRPARAVRRTPGCPGRSAPRARPGARSRRPPTRAPTRPPRPRSALPTRRSSASAAFGLDAAAT